MKLQDIEFIEIGKKKIYAEKINFCTYCNFPSKDLIVCSGKNCKIMLCSGCRTYIENIPFCNECLSEIIKHKTFIIITKGELKEDE